MFIDTHCHLDDTRFDGCRADVLDRARMAGVHQMITIGCDISTSTRAKGIVAAHHDIWFSAGIHPHEAKGAPKDYIDHLLKFAKHPRCVAIGECGLDYYYERSPRDIQKRIFKEQLKLASKINKPLIVHVRDAWQDCISILDIEKSRKFPVIIHCFSGPYDFAMDCLKRGFFLSISGIVTFEKAGEIPLVVRDAPLEQLLIETDAPYLAPVPHRSKRNEPAFVVEVAKKISELKSLDINTVANVTSENARRVFQLN